MLGEFEAWMLVDLESQGKWQGASEKTVAGFQYRSALPLQICRASRNHRLRQSHKGRFATFKVAMLRVDIVVDIYKLYLTEFHFIIRTNSK